MQLDQETIEQQLALLANHRRRLAYRLRQHARLGDYAPPDVVLDAEDARAAIQQIKTELRAAGAVVGDEPNDIVTTNPTVILGRPEQRDRTLLLQKVRAFWLGG